jgi:hypothetical protein
MAYEATSDLLESPNRLFEIEDSLGSRNVVRRQLQLSEATDTTQEVALEDMREGYWVVPDAANLHQYKAIPSNYDTSIATNRLPAWVCVSLRGSQPDVSESGGVTGAQGVYTGRTKVYDTTDATYAPGDLLTLGHVDIGDGLAGPLTGGSAGLHPGLKKAGATAGNAVARVEFFDAANGVLEFVTLHHAG